MSIPEIKVILAGETFSCSSLQQGNFISEVYADSPVVSFAARTDGNSAGAQQDRAVAGVYAASDAKCLVAATGVVYGPFDTLYASTTSDPIRFRISQKA